MNQHVRDITLDDKYALEKGTVYLTGIQVLVRFGMDQIRRDRMAGLNTAGYVSGYRGSPLGGYDQQLAYAKKFLKPLNIVAEPGINEELAMTAVWGTQKIGSGMNIPSDYDGVFGIWYGKGPGVDRSTDVLKHASHSGTHKLGGVVVLAGDDHMAKSSTLAIQSEWIFVDAEVPVFNPSDLQDVLDYGLHAIALSRYAGLWAGVICMADNMDSSGLIRVDSGASVILPTDIQNPRDAFELNRQIILKGRMELEKLTRMVKLPAVEAYVRANTLNKITFGAQKPSTLLVASGKAYRDLRQALDMMGIDESAAQKMGIGIFKVAMPWPLEPQGIRAVAQSAERMIVVEHKRGMMEVQIKEQLYNLPADKRPQIFGKTDPLGAPLLPTIGELSPDVLVRGLLNAFPPALVTAEMRSIGEMFDQRTSTARGNGELAKRTPYFCSGCPHNSSTKTPEGSFSMAGIGCHIMTEFADRTTEGSTAMGGEGVPWIGMKNFTPQKHMFVNMGDGTYFHSGSMAIRYSVAAKVPVTYKILYNDAVAMTGGQHVDGQLDVPQITRQMAAEGVQRIVVLTENLDQYVGNVGLAPNVQLEHRDALIRVQEELQNYPDVSVLIYDQTCAAEKRRRRKRGIMPQVNDRIFINDRVCEGCGDCSVQSNCLSVEPKQTEFGIKRTINQSSCNRDFSCVKGFCPSFVTVTGGKLRKASGHGLDVEALADALPKPHQYALTNTYDCLITGIGGMGITTTAAVMAMAAHVDGLNTLTLDMTGLAQKGGPVVSHIRFAPRGQEIHGAHVPVANLDVFLAADILVAAQADQLLLTNPERTHMVANNIIAPTAEFVLHQTQSFEQRRIEKTLKAATKSYNSAAFADLAEKVLGDALYANMMLVGYAMQNGLLPISLDALRAAIHLNGAQVKNNLLALDAGRLLAAQPEHFKVLEPKAPTPQSLDERIEFLAQELVAYQDQAYSTRFTKLVQQVYDKDTHQDKKLTKIVADNLYKLMAIKDEYEVARLYASPEFKAKLAEQFEGDVKLSLSLAPPLISPIDPNSGRPQKRQFGAWIFTAFNIMAKFKGLRGSAFDIFGMTAERKMERKLLAEYEATIQRILNELNGDRYELACKIAGIPDIIRGYGPVKEGNVHKAAIQVAVLWEKW